MANKITLSELRKLVKQVINEGPYDEIDFGFMDDQDKIKESMKIEISEYFYNKMAKDRDLLKELYNLLSLHNGISINDLMPHLKESEYYNNIESYMDDIYSNPKYTKIFSNKELNKILNIALGDFISNAYVSFEKRRRRNDNFFKDMKF